MTLWFCFVGCANDSDDADNKAGSAGASTAGDSGAGEQAGGGDAVSSAGAVGSGAMASGGNPGSAGSTSSMNGGNAPVSTGCDLPAVVETCNYGTSCAEYYVTGIVKNQMCTAGMDGVYSQQSCPRDGSYGYCRYLFGLGAYYYGQDFGTLTADSCVAGHGTWCPLQQ